MDIFSDKRKAEEYGNKNGLDVIDNPVILMKKFYDSLNERGVELTKEESNMLDGLAVIQDKNFDVLKSAINYLSAFTIMRIAEERTEAKGVEFGSAEAKPIFMQVLEENKGAVLHLFATTGRAVYELESYMKELAQAISDCTETHKHVELAQETGVN